jgi:hypothetical protein
MESVFFNGGMIGATLDYGATDRYVIGETTGTATIELVGNTGRVTLTGASINLPSGLQPGDLVIIASSSDGTTPAYATGYTAGQRGRPDSTGYQWCYKFMGNPVDTTASGLTNNITTTHLAIAFRGVSSTTPLDATSPAVATDDAGSPNPPAITTATNNAVVVALGFLDDDLVSASAGAPTNYTFAAASQSSSSGSTVMAAFRTKTPAGSEDPGAFSGGSDDWAAATLALRPGTATIPLFGNLKNSGIWLLQAAYENSVANIILPGQTLYTAPGTYSWTAPAGVTSVSVVAVGGGGASGDSGGNWAGAGGGGGGLGWKNAISVVPGQSYTVVVGAGGTNPSGNGGTSYFINTSTVAGNGGIGGTSTDSQLNGGVGGTFVGDGGGNGGQGGRTGNNAGGGAGGGAGGYTGNGGNGGAGNNDGLPGTAGAGGGGGGGEGSSGGTRGGGGVGLNGEGTSGAYGSADNGGSGGAGGVIAASSGQLTGGAYGGGGGAEEDDTTITGTRGAGGAIRIIWGSNRAFPSTNTGDL